MGRRGGHRLLGSLLEGAEGGYPRCPKTGCLRYEDEHRAFRAKHRSKARENDLSHPLVNAYPCRFCGGWHHTSQEFDPAKGAKKPGWAATVSRILAPPRAPLEPP